MAPGSWTVLAMVWAGLFFVPPSLVAESKARDQKSDFVSTPTFRL